MTYESKPLTVACVLVCNEEETTAILQGQRYVGRVVVCDGVSMDLNGEHGR